MEVQHVLQPPTDRRLQFIRRHIRRIDGKDLVFAGREQVGTLIAIRVQVLCGFLQSNQIRIFFERKKGQQFHRGWARRRTFDTGCADAFFLQANGKQTGSFLGFCEKPHIRVSSENLTEVKLITYCCQSFFPDRALVATTISMGQFTTKFLDGFG
ncbi:MAG TPA: hypothetical protein VJ698_09260 [Noviherbaspirillum sp.]|uniref:hypothetical protein n=1 Tax=Noviherbaspirillum sp. TaxID=1926288 RepID=UPI002B48BD06|nr:hypothetical protein [Noviherbaspirillum sp.]HJV85654.1 hypothetical protein [Noviherbaspirillum sp.]